MRSTKKDTKIKEAVKDYYNSFGVREREIALYITGRKKIEMTQEEKSDVWAIRTNIEVGEYS